MSIIALVKEDTMSLDYGLYGGLGFRIFISRIRAIQGPLCGVPIVRMTGL